MAAIRKVQGEPSKKRRPPARTPEARENQLIAESLDLAERQILDGTVSSQVLTHFVKLGTVRESLEREKLRKENLLLEARVAQIANSGKTEAMYSEALAAMRQYTGQEPDEEYYD